MKTTIDKEFFEKWKDKKVAMWCKKEEYAEKFCKLMHEQGLVWKSGSCCKTFTHWNVFKESTVYEFGKKVLCGDITEYEEKGYTILDFEDYIVKEKMTKQELVELMIENFTNEYGMLDLSHLDFTKFDCSINISSMEVAINLYQDNQKVQGDLYQDNQEVGEDLYQSNQEVGEDLYQSNQTVQGEIFQREPNKCKNNSNNLPPHYNIAGIDTMDLILKICEHNNTGVREGFYLANTLKYLIRYNNKNGIYDLEKAKDYLNRLINEKGE